MGAKTARPNREPLVVDIEGGTVSEREIKAAREVAADVMSDRDFLRLANRIIDEARDGDSSQTRAARDRDRATPRDVSSVESDRLRAELPALDEFREALSGRQRKLRSVVKNRVRIPCPMIATFSPSDGFPRRSACSPISHNTVKTAPSSDAPSGTG